MRFIRPAAFVALSIFVSALTAQAQGLSITNYQKVSQQNLTANKANVTYRADLVNTGAALSSVTATVTGQDPFAVRVIQGQDTLNFSPVPANSQVTSSNTFTIQIDPTVPFDFNSKLQWTFQSAAGGPIANAGFNQTSTVGSTVTLDGSKSSNPSGVGTLTYSWAFTSIPAGSTAFLSHPNSVMPSFVIDVSGNYVITLTVSNGSGSSSASTTVSTFHTKPVANAGQNQTVGLNATVVLNGSNSTSPDGRPLTYAWTLTSVPAGSTAVLSNTTAVSPSFVADKAGTYMAQLIVNDGLASDPATVAVAAQGVVKPVANAGPNQLVNVNTVVHLTGAASTDANSLPLTYQWNLITVPAGSTASLTNPTSVTPSFVADQQGVYVAQLIVNNGSLNSDPSTVTITTQTPLGPTANAGPNQTVTLGATVTLSGSGTDPQNLPLTYHWTLTTRPAGSAAVLSSTTAQNPIFTADVTGTYIAQLVVNNGTQNSQPSTVTVTTTCSQPTARPGQAQNVGVGATVTLNGSTSGDSCNDPLTYSWTFISRPAGSSATLTGATTVSPTFVTDVVGTYIVQLIVNNGLTSSNPATVSVTATSGLAIVFFPGSINLDTAPKNTTLLLTSVAPAGGQLVNLTSNNPNIATIQGTVLIPAGQASVSVSVTPGTSSGTAIITASAPGYASGDLSVTVSLPSLSVTLDSQTIGLSNTINGIVALSAPAPSGATVTVSANPGGIVTINPVSVTVAPGSNVGAFTLTGTTVGGPVTITASSPGYNSGSSQVSVSARGAITLPSTFSVAPNQTLTYPVSLVTGAPLGGVTLQLVSSDPSKVTVSPTVFIPFKGTVPDVPAQVTGLTGGNVTITATAPGFISGTGTVTVVNPAISVALDSSTVGVGGTINGSITLSVPAPSAMTVTLSTNPSGIVTVQPVSIPIAAGGTTGAFTVSGGGSAGGPVTITASAPGYTTGSASVSVGIGQLGKITLPTNVTVGTNQSVTFPVVLQTGAPAGGVTVSLSSSDPTKVVISPSSVFIPFKSTTPATQPQITGINFGTATISASAPGFTGDSQPVQVTGSLSFSSSSMAVVLGATQQLGLQLSSPAPAGGLTVNLVSSDPSKVTVPAAVSYAANTSLVQVPVTAVANGSVTLTASAPGLTSGTASINVITLGQIALPANVSPAQGQTVAFPISLSSPAQAGGVVVTLVSSDTSKVTVTSSVTVPQGSNTPTIQPQVTGVNLGTANITATAVGYQAATQQVKVPGALSFSPGSLNFIAGTSQNFTLNISPAAPPGGLTINLSSDNTSIATVPSTVTFSAGSTSVTFPVTGVSNGTAVIHASALPAIADATGSVTIQTRGSILLPANVSVAQGQSAAFAVTLSAPAPAGGTTVSLVSSDPSKVTISLSSVTIAQGAVSPASQPQVTGVAPGSATITGSSPGWTSGSQTVQVTNLTMSFSPSSQTIGGNSTQNFALNLSSPAPAGGLTVSLASSNTGVATVPSSVFFASGATSVNVPVIGTGPGSATITASAANIANATASVTVQSDILLPANVSVLPGNVAAFPVTLTKPAPAGGVFLTLTSSNPQVLTVSPTNIFITQGGTVSNQPQVTGVANGSATVTVSGSGLSPASQVVTVGSGGGTLTMSFSPSGITLNGGATQSLTLNLSGAAPAGGIVVNLNSSNTGVATVPSSVSIGAGGTSASVPVTGVAGAGGQATITASASGIQSTTASVTVNGSVTPGISVSNVSVVVGQSAAFTVTLGAAAPAGGVTVSLVSNNTAKATVPSSVFIAAGATTSQPQVTGVAAGSATITATAPGYTSGSGTATVNASGGSSSFSPGSLPVTAGSSANLTLNLSAVAPAGGVTATLSSSNTAAATVPGSVNIPAGATSVTFAVTGVAAGSATITANTPNFGSANATVTVSAASSGIILPNVTTIQLGQTVPFPVSLSTAAPSGGVFITLSSSDTSKATVQPANVFISQGGSVSNQPNLTGVAVGTVTITASANGLGTVTQQVQVVSGASLSFSPSSVSLTPGGSQNLSLTLPSAAPAGGVTINLTSSNSAVASVPATVSVNSFGTSVSVPVTAGAPGSATITASLAGFGSATAGVTVTGASPIILPSNVSLEPGDTVSFPVTLSAPAPAGGAFINLSSSDTSKVTISPSAVFISAGLMSGTTPKITGVGFGTATITAQASGVGTASQQVNVGSSASFQPATLVIQGTATTKSLTLSLTAPAPAGGLVVSLSSSNTSVATVPSTVTIQANNSTVNVPVTSVSPGTTSIQASSLPVFPATAGTVTVVGAPSVILPTFQTVGIRNTAPLPVVLSAPAPAGGVTVNLASSDTSKFTVTPSVFIAAGQTTSSTPVILTGGDFISSEGFAFVTATATGYAGAELQMHIGDAITIAIPSNLTVGIGKSIPLPVALPGIAPAGGVTLTITSSNPGVATITATAFIPAGQNMPPTLPVLTGVAPGVVTIEASAANYTSAVQTVQVQ